MSRKYYKRIMFDSALFLSLFFMPWWVTILLGVIFLYIFDSYFELLFLGFFIDVLYGKGNTGFLLGYPFTVLGSLFFLLSYGVKEHLVFTRT